MPFYLRTASRRPLWQPALWAGAALILWALVLRLLARGTTRPRLGGLAQALNALVLAAVAGGVAATLYWALGTPRLRRSFELRLASATAASAVLLTALTLAAGLGAPDGPWARVTRHEFVLSTALVALVFGWFIARDPLGLTRETERVYLTPKDVAALSDAERARLALETETNKDGEKESSA